jgi:hypothetical protein
VIRSHQTITRLASQRDAPKAARGLHYLSAAADAADALAQLHAHKVSARHGDSFSFLFHESNAAFSDVDPDIIKQSHMGIIIGNCTEIIYLKLIFSLV